jgi:hypothetical protein
MFASFSSTESGCDQCADISSAFSSPIQNVTNAVNPYAQGLNQNQQSAHYNNVMQSNSVGLNQNNVNTLNNNLNNLPPPTNSALQQSNGQVAMQQMVQKAVQRPNTNTVANGPQAPKVPAKKQANEVVVEPFTQPQVQVNIPSKLILLNLVTILILALAVNESFKYYINRGLQMADGSPHYYAFYALGAVLLAMVMYYVSIKVTA